MSKKRTLALGLVLAGSLILAPVASATAAPAPVGTTAIAAHAVAAEHVVTAKAKKFTSCKKLNKVYKGGVAKKGVKYNKVSGKNRAFKVKPKISTALYKANKKLDRDKDGIACEK